MQLPGAETANSLNRLTKGGKTKLNRRDCTVVEILFYQRCFLCGYCCCPARVLFQ